MLKVFLIEKNQKIINDISLCLNIGFSEVQLIPASDVRQVPELIRQESPNLVILDSSLYDSNCLDSIMKIRKHSDVPMLILSEAETDIDRAMGLEAGADKYMGKPFNLMELLATCRAMLRRSHDYGFVSKQSISDDKISVNFNTQEVYFAGKEIKLTPIEYKLLIELLRNEGRILTHNAILEKVWGTDYLGDRSFVKKYIYRLRSKLEFNGHRKLIRSVRGIGYKLSQQF